MTDTTYNGWKNYQTWNVALYIQNDYALYCLAREWVKEEHGQANVADYSRFSEILRRDSFGVKTPDGVRWDDESLDTDRLTEMLQEIA
jgi:hypothetical protein